MGGKSEKEREQHVLEWLLEEEQPAVRYLTLTDLMNRGPADPEVVAARSRIPKVGWAADMLRRQKPGGFWENHLPENLREYVDFTYYPKYNSTNWVALVLSDMGLDRSNTRIRKLAELVFKYKLSLGSPFNFFHEEVCVAGNTARFMTKFGYSEDRRVQKLFNWLVEDQREDGGWNCSQGTPGTLDCWEALAAFAALPKEQRSRQVQDATSKGVEFYLERRLFEEGRKYMPWFRFHYPNHYFYDVLLGLDVITQLGYGDDPRLEPALGILRKKRLADGTWAMDSLHPDFGLKRDKEAAKKSRPLVVEEAGRPSKWITLRALRILKRVNEAA